MFEFDFELDLGSRRRQTEWVSVASEPEKPNKLNKRQRHRQREQKRKSAAATGPQQQSAASEPAAITPAQAKYRKEYRDSSVVCLSTEIESGNVEYKYCLSGCISNPNRRHQLVTQMKYRLSEGGGECFYYIGVEDDGYPRGLDPTELADTMAIISSMAASLAATARLVEHVQGGFGRLAALIHIKANAEEGMKATDLRVAVAGSMDSGKSTLVAVLTHGCDGRPLLDNCRGSARMAVFRHKHEIETGRTSSISQQVLGYDDEGRVLNYVGVAAPTPADIAAAAARVLSFIDMGGHEKYLKTTLYGMTCTLPDYVLLCIDAQCGVTHITREHLAVAVALEIPTALVITKSDAVDSWQLQAVLQQLQRLMAPVLSSTPENTAAAYVQEPTQQGSPIEVAASAPGDGPGTATAAAAAKPGAGIDPTGCGGVPMVLSESQASSLAAMLSELHSCTQGAAASFHQVIFPVFTVSCVTGAGLSLLHAFLSRLHPVSTHKSNRLHREVVARAAVARNSATAAQGSNSSGHVDAAAKKPENRLAATQAEQGSTHSDDEREQQSTFFCADKGLQDKQQQRRQQLLLGLEGPSSLWVPEPHTADPLVASTAAGHTATSQSAEGDTNAVASMAAGTTSGGVPAGHFQVVHTYDVEGVGWVVSGIAVAGTIKVGQTLLWGPTPNGGFTPVSVSCIQRSHVPVRQVQPGQTATLALQQAGPGIIPSSSKEALLSAAAAAQAAAEAAAAREAAAACAAAPSIPFGKPYAAPRRGGRLRQASAASAKSNDGVVSATPVNGHRSTSDCCLNDSSFDALADGLAADLSLDDAVGGSSSSLGGSSEFEYECFRAFDDECATATSASNSASSGSLEQDALPTGGSVLVGLGSSAGTAGPHNSIMQYNRHAPAEASAGGCQKVSPTVATRKSITAPKSVPAVAAASQHGSATPLGCSPSNWRSKGAVLLDTAAAPKTYWEFEALLVLLGGLWPARGLLSGCWPPDHHPEPCDSGQDSQRQQVHQATAAAAQTFYTAGAEKGVTARPAHAATELTRAEQACQLRKASEAAAANGRRTVNHHNACGEIAAAEQTTAAATATQHARVEAPASRRRPTKQHSKRDHYAYVIHCNSIRQIAWVVHMQELRQHVELDITASSCSTGGACPKLGSPAAMQHCGLSASIHAAAALLHDQCDGSSGADSGSSSGTGSTRQVESRGAQRSRSGSADLGTLVAVRFRFTHRPEWMQVGARLIVRDRSDGQVAAAGFVTQLLDAHTQQH